jgi:hypothetical protein
MKEIKILHGETKEIRVKATKEGMLESEIATYTYNVLGIIEITGSLSAFTSDEGEASESQNYSLKGIGLAARIYLTAPTGFELSINNEDWYDEIDVAADFNGTIYVRISADAEAGEISGNIEHSSAGVTSRNLAVSGTVASASTMTETPKITVSDAGVITITCGTPDTTIYYTKDGSTPDPEATIPAGTTIEYDVAKVNRTLIPITIKAVAVHADSGSSAVAEAAPEDMIANLLTAEMSDFGGSIVDSDALASEIAYIKANGLWNKIGYLIGKDFGVRTGTDAAAYLARTTKVAFSFDDGAAPATMATAARLEAYGGRGTFCINSNKVGTDGYITWANVAALVAAGHEVIDHGWSHSAGAVGAYYDTENPGNQLFIYDLTPGQLHNEMFNSDQDFDANGFDPPIHYAVPKYGMDYDNSLPILMQYRRTIRGYNSEDLNYLGNYREPHSKNWNAYYSLSYAATAAGGLATAQADITSAAASKSPAFLASHSTDNDPNYFEQLLDWIVNTMGLDIITCGALIDETNAYCTKYYNLVKRNFEVIAHLDNAWNLGDKDGLVVFDCDLADLPSGVLTHYENLGFDIAFWEDESEEAFAYLVPNDDVFLDGEPVTCDTNYSLSRFAIPGIAGATIRFPASGVTREPVTLSGATPPGGMSFETTYYAQAYGSSHVRLYDAATAGNLVQYSSVGSGVKMTTTSTLRSLLYNYTPSAPNPADCTNIRCLKKMCRILAVDATSSGLIVGNLASSNVGGTLAASNLHYLRKLGAGVAIHGFLSGAVDDRLLNVYSWKSMSLSYGYISSILEEICKSPLRRILAYLYLQYNSIADQIPENIGELVSILTLNLSYNGITGAIPVELALVGTSASSPVRIYLSDNGITSYETGAIGVGQTQLIYWDVKNNAITTKSQIDQIILDLLTLVRAGGSTTGTLKIDGGTNAAPSATGLANIAILEGGGDPLNGNAVYSWAVTNNT